MSLLRRVVTWIQLPGSIIVLLLLAASEPADSSLRPTLFIFATFEAVLLVLVGLVALVARRRGLLK